MSMSEPTVSQSFRGRRYNMKSAPAITPVTPSKARLNSTNFTQLPMKDVVTPPQSPKTQQQSPTTSAKKRRKSKPKLRDVSSDGRNAQQGYDSPPHCSSNDESNAQTSPTSGGVQSTPTKAYAGPNFHSSPAPSSLPVPSWFSKSVPATPTTGKSLQAMLQINETKLSLSLEEPESHLQMLFRVHKEEKARNCQQVTCPPKLAALTNGSPKSIPHPSPNVSERPSLDLFTMSGEKNNILTSPRSPYKICPQVLFSNNSKPTPVPTKGEARKQADTLKLFLNQPQVSSEKVPEALINYAVAPTTPTKKSLPAQPKYPPSTASLKTPPKRTPPKKTTPHQLPTADSTLSPPKHQRGYRSTNPKVPSPAREYASYLPHSYSDRTEIKTDSVLQFTEMQLYLQRVKAMEPRSIASPAVVS